MLSIGYRINIGCRMKIGLTVPVKRQFLRNLLRPNLNPSIPTAGEFKRTKSVMAYDIVHDADSKLAS